MIPGNRLRSSGARLVPAGARALVPAGARALVPIAGRGAVGVAQGLRGSGDYEWRHYGARCLVPVMFGVFAGIICLSAKSLQGCKRSALAGGNDGAPGSAHSIVYSAPPYP